MDWLEFLTAAENKAQDFWSSLKNAWSQYSTFFARFHIRGIPKMMNELVSEMVTLGTAGLAVLLVLALPAFEATEENWRAKGQYSVTFLDRYGNEIGRRGIRHNDSVPLSEIPDYMIKATLATEDRRFFEHYGIDPLGLARAMITNARAGEVVQGGSTLTQQLAKNLFLTSERSLQRKISEAFLSLWLETHLSKKEILNEYFKRAYMGGGAYGLEAAAQFYFDKSIRNVSLAEASMLAGLYKAPTKYAPHKNLPTARERANEVLSNLVEAGYLTEGQIYEAKIKPAKAVVRPETYSPGYFLDWAFEETKRITKGKGEFVLTVKTTVDLDLQRDAERIVGRILRQKGRRYRATQAALVGMEAHTGAVRAIVGGRDYEKSQFNRATNGKRQPGSSIKPYVYFSAIKELGYVPRTRVRDSRSVKCGSWSPRNFGGRYRGWVPMSFALQKSINTVAVYLANKVGRKKIVKNMELMGLKGMRPNCTMPIGTDAMSVIKHVSAYATFATGGMRVADYVVEEIRNSYGELVYSHEKVGPKTHRIFKRSDVAKLNRMLGRVVQRGGTAPRAALNFTTVAGKTGTTNRSRDAWFMGYTGKYVAGVWFGNDNYRPMSQKSYGGTLPAETWHDFMVAAHKDPNIPRIPGLPIHPNQKGRMSALEARKKEDPAIGRAAMLGRGLSQATRKVLLKLSQKLQNAPAIDSSKIVSNRAQLGR